MNRDVGVGLEAITRPQYFVFRVASANSPLDQVTFVQLNRMRSE